MPRQGARAHAKAESPAGPVTVVGLPTGAAVSSATMSGTTAFALVTMPGTAMTVWRFPLDGPATVAVTGTGLAQLKPASVSLAAWPQGLIVMGERCDSAASSGECTADSGIVQLRSDTGALTSTVTLWKDQPTQAGGDTPTFLGSDKAGVWILAVDRAVEIDGSGTIIDQVPVQQPAKVCMHDGELVNVTQTVPAGGSDAQQSGGSDVSVVPSGPGEGVPATLTMHTWNGSRWESTSDGALTDVGAYPVVTCQGSTIAVWDQGTIAATWTADGPWATVPKPTRTPDAHVPPTIAHDGAIFRLDDTFHLLKLDIVSGEFIDTGLMLEPTTENSHSFLTVTVAESDDTMFACSGRATGLPDGPTTPGTVCRFAPINP